MPSNRTARSLPGTVWARLKVGLTLLGALAQRGIAVLGLRSLDYAFQRNRSRELKGPLRFLVILGYWMLGGVTTGKWDSPEAPVKPSSRLP